MSFISAEKEDFWKGIAAGFLAGMAVAAALRYTPLEKYIDRMKPVEGTLENKPAVVPEPMQAPWRQPATGLGMFARSDQSENSSERADHIDVAQELRKYQAFNMGSAG